MKTAIRILLICVALACTDKAYGQAAVISGQTINQYGQPVPYASVRVCSVTSTGTPCTPTTPIYADYGLTVPLANPTSADQYGNYTVYTPALPAPNLYLVQLSPTTGVTWSYIFNGPYCSLSGCTSTGPIGATYFNATTFPFYEVNGVQLASTNLLDTANIAYKNAANTFTGTQTAPIVNVTTQFNVAGVQIASANLSDGANLAKINAANIFTGGIQKAAGFNATNGFQFNGTATTNHVLLGNGTNYVDSATIPYSVISGGGPFAGSGVPCATSTTVSTVCTSPQIVAALNSSPSTVLATVLLPTTGTPGTYISPVSITTDAYGRVTAAVSGGGTTPVSRTCGANGCYKIFADGTIEEWGTVTAPTAGGSVQTATITYPYAFASLPILTITANNGPDGTNNDAMTTYATGGSTTGATVVIRCATNIGGSGCPNLSNAVPVSWQAKY